MTYLIEDYLDLQCYETLIPEEDYRKSKKYEKKMDDELSCDHVSLIGKICESYGLDVKIFLASIIMASKAIERLSPQFVGEVKIISVVSLCIAAKFYSSFFDYAEISDFVPEVLDYELAQVEMLILESVDWNVPVL
ncbi:hypothetical protein GJ496_001933 [Pomphorhynchus laevis]|nr:hypothetical protein GJ496_001933 [Pomphorhynchus laevis]